jgi:hypothetical protein
MSCCRAILGLCIISALGFDHQARAQQPPATRVYALHRAYKVDLARRAEFEKFFLGTIKKFHMARKDAGVEMGWNLTKVVLPAGEEASYHYISTAFSEKFPALDPSPADLAPFIEKAGSTPEKFRESLFGLGTLVRIALSSPVERLGEIEPGDFLRVDYMKVPPGKGADYVAMERTVYKPLHERRIKEGHISAWTLNAVIYPGGTQRDYDFFTLNAVKKSDGFGAMNSGYGLPFFSKVHPDLNYFSTVTRTSELRSLVNTRYIRVMEMVR